MKGVDPYAVLGVRRDASPNEIRQAFAAGVRAAHPDAGGSPSAASERLAELITARDTALVEPAPAQTPGPVYFYQRPHGLERIVALVLAGLPPWGRPRRPRRNLQ
jgi:hypothetical protein